MLNMKLSRTLTTLQQLPRHARRSRKLTHLLVLDFEATCGDTISNAQREIIEFPTLLYNLHKKEVQGTFHEYVRPTRNPALTEFCTTLTGITQGIVNEADRFSAVWLRYLDFLRDNDVIDDPESYCFVTCGDWDLLYMLPDQLAYTAETEAAFSPTLQAPFDRWINIKKAYKKYYKEKHNKGMAGILRRLGLELEGRHHSGIDDCRNILRIVQKMQADGWQPQSSIEDH